MAPSIDRQALLGATFDATPSAVVITDARATILDANASFAAITGYTLDEVRGRNINILQSGWHNKAYYQRMWSSLLDEGVWQGEIRNRRKDGELFVEVLTICAVGHEERYYVGVFSDMSLMSGDGKNLFDIAFYDALTGLANRSLVLDRLKVAISRTDRFKTPCYLFFLDLDGFKEVNDTFGHHAGDAILETVANRLMDKFRATDTVGRLSGDEFIVILESIQLESDVQRLATETVFGLSRPYVQKVGNIQISASLGAIKYLGGPCQPETLIRSADAAMYEAKRAGKNHVCWAEPIGRIAEYASEE